MKIDAFAHALPSAYRDFVFSRVGTSFPFSQFWSGFQPLTEVNHRIGVLDECGVDIQVVSTTGPPVDTLTTDVALAGEFARVANDSMAAWVGARPDRFVGIANVSLRNSDNAVAEIERSVKDLGLRGVLLYADSTAPPLDDPRFDAIFATAESLNVPIWLHPWRSRAQSDYQSEEESKFLSFYVFGWPYETTVSMLRLAAGGVLERHPRLSVVAHHAGAMVPFFAKRIEHLYGEQWVKLAGIEEDLARPITGVVERFRSFYADAVTFGSISAMMSTYEFFGGSHILFGTDAPFDAKGGQLYTEACIRGVEGMSIPEQEKDKIWSQNALRLLGLPSS